MTEEYRHPTEDGGTRKSEDSSTLADPGEPGAGEQVTEANAGEEVQADAVTREALPPQDLPRMLTLTNRMTRGNNSTA